jgi:hypothetical protein
MYSTSSLFSANPRPIKGSSSSSIPIDPPPSESSELKHSFNFLISSSEKSKTSPFPREYNHFLYFYS